MRIVKSSSIRTVEIEFNQSELEDLFEARANMRTVLEENVNLGPSEHKALEDSIYLISTVLGNHQ